MKKIFFVFIVSLLLVSCARVGSPVGGHKDTIPPNLIGSNIDTTRVNISQNLKELRLDFDEYITLDKITKNLIISPPIKKIKKIYPTSLANRYVLIQWEDTLQANTTYNFNFGNAIKDNNENNVLRYFNFAFSTGDKLDNNYISGEVQNLLPSKSNNSSSQKDLIVGLYKDKDSIDYKQKPYYISNADDDGYYELNFLSPGDYKIIAYEDQNGNGIFDTGLENIGFFKDKITIEEGKNFSGKNISITPSAFPFKYKETVENPGGALMLFEGNPEKLQINAVSENIKDLKVTHRKFSDTAYVWFDAKKDSIGVKQSTQLKFSFDTGAKQDTVSLFYRQNPKNEMKISNPYGNSLAPKTSFSFISNYALDNINTEKWTMVSDSISQPFDAKISDDNPFKIVVNSDFKEGKKYSLTVPKESVTSYFDKIGKSYRFDFEVDKAENYGTVTVNIANPPSSKFWIQLLDTKMEAVYSKYTTGSYQKFNIIKPATYIVRILVDNNANEHWDPADFEKGIFAEDAYIFKKKITARPMWEIVETWDLKDPKTNGIPTEVTDSNPKNTIDKEEPLVIPTQKP